MEKSLLQNDVISLRAIEPEDLDILYRWENDTSLWIHGTTLSPYSKIILRQYIADAMIMDVTTQKQLRLIAELKVDKSVIGTIDLYDIDLVNRRAGIGILVDNLHKNKGYAAHLLQLIQEYAFNFLGLHQLYAHISEDNSISLHIFEKAGYDVAGTLDQWIYRSGQYKNVIIVQLIHTT